MGPGTVQGTPALAGYERRGLLRRASPFLALIGLGFAIVPMPPAGDRPVPIAIAAAILLAVVLAVVLAPWERLPGFAQVLPLLGTLAVIAFLRAAEGGSASAESPVMLAPVVWSALYGRRGQLAAVIGGVAAAFVIPRVAIGGPHYPFSEWERVVIWPSACLIIGIAVQSLVARINEQAQQLRELATTDALTGLANRRIWDEALARELSRASRSGEPLTLCLIDLNAFKAYNDSHGHPAGDALLKTIAARWTGAMRGGEILARLGGDEFGLLLPGADRSEADAVRHRLGTLMPSGQSFAAGFADSDETDSAARLTDLADERLYAEKAAQRAGASAALTA